MLISMLSMERCPSPDQFLGSTTFLLAGVLSKYPVTRKIVPFGSSGAAASAYEYTLTQPWLYPAQLSVSTVLPQIASRHIRPPAACMWCSTPNILTLLL